MSLGGREGYKEKYGVFKTTVPRLIMGKYEILYQLRNLAKKMLDTRKSILGYMSR